MKKNKDDCDCEYAEVSYPHDVTPGTGDVMGGLCDNAWSFQSVDGWGDTPRQAQTNLFAKARKISAAHKLRLDCGTKDCVMQPGVCIYKAELTPGRPQRIPFFDLEAPEGTPPRFEYLMVGKMRFGCFCDRTI